MSDETPSWVAAPAATPSATPAAAPSTGLRLLVVITVVQVVLEVAHVAGRDELVVGFRAFLALVVLLQLPLAVLTARHSAIAAMGMLVYEATTVVASLTGAYGDHWLVLGGSALLWMALLAGSLHTFPTPTLPPIATPERE